MIFQCKWSIFLFSKNKRCCLLLFNTVVCICAKVIFTSRYLKSWRNYYKMSSWKEHCVNTFQIYTLCIFKRITVLVWFKICYAIWKCTQFIVVGSGKKFVKQNETRFLFVHQWHNILLSTMLKILFQEENPNAFKLYKDCLYFNHILSPYFAMAEDPKGEKLSLCLA